MIITVKKNVREEDLNKLIKKLEKYNLKANLQHNELKTLLSVIGDTTQIDDNAILAFNFVEKVSRITAPFKLVNRKLFKEDRIVKVNKVEIGNNKPIAIIAGPCSVESKQQLTTIAKSVKSSGAKLLRGGAFKPRTSPYSFQGLKEKAIDLLKAANKKYELPTVSEISSSSQISLFEKI